MNLITIDSSGNGLSFGFSPHEDRTRHVDAKSRKPESCLVTIPAGFADERSVAWNWTQKTFDRAFKELSNYIRTFKIRLKINELFEINQVPLSLSSFGCSPSFNEISGRTDGQIELDSKEI